MKTVLITGCSSGYGLETARHFHARGWTVVASMRHPRPDLFPMDEIYAEIRKLSPHALISFKQGATGREDFAAPERKASSLADSIRSEFGENAASVAAKSWSAHQNKHNETCSTMQRGVKNSPPSLPSAWANLPRKYS